MALRLAGEEFSVVRGLDALGWPREIEANDAVPGLKVTQSGSGLGLQVVSGNLGIGTNKLIGTTVYLKESASNRFSISKVSDDSLADLVANTLYLNGGNLHIMANKAILTENGDDMYVTLEARDNGVGLVEVARLQGQAEPRFKFSLPAQLYTKATTGDPAGVEGDLYVNLFDNALRLYADAAWRTVISWV